MAESSQPASVRSRRVLFFGGFDPHGPRRYYAMYASEAAAQAAASGYQVNVGPRSTPCSLLASWQVRGRFGADEPEVATDYQFMRWEDLVREHWPRNRLGVIGATLTSSARIIVNGMLWRSLKGSWPAFLALAAPLAVLMIALVGILLLVTVPWQLAERGSPVWAAALLAIGGAGLWYALEWAEHKVQMAWLMRSLRYVLRQARGLTPELEHRIDEFAAHVRASAALKDIDELLLVGHSSGTMLAISALARALDAEPTLGQGALKVSLLTLGQSTPVLSFQPEARRFRRELARVAQAPAIDWLDFTAPADACCCALTDPTRVCEELRGTSWRSPKLLSPRFPTLFAPDRYREIRRDKYRCHFQYLLSTELPGRYDYFAITTGPLTLAERFEDLPSLDDFTQLQLFGGPWR